MSTPPDVTVVFFDGVCVLCNHFADFLIRRDTPRRLRYAPLQSALFAEISARFPQLEGKDSLVTYIRVNGVERVEVFSDASLAAFAQLPSPWSWLVVLRFFPKGLRNVVYHFVARSRYRLLGKKDSCRLPRPEERELFIDSLPV
jgi:predicted DCC family thiol-disulfide oxidoreductase YuxK